MPESFEENKKEAHRPEEAEEKIERMLTEWGFRDIMRDKKVLAEFKKILLELEKEVRDLDVEQKKQKYIEYWAQAGAMPLRELGGEKISREEKFKVEGRMLGITFWVGEELREALPEEEKAGIYDEIGKRQKEILVGR